MASTWAKFAIVIRKRQFASLASLLALVLGHALAAAAPAHASSSAIFCVGWTFATYTPGLTNAVQPTTATVDGDLNVIDDHSPIGICLGINSSATAGERDVTRDARALLAERLLGDLDDDILPGLEHFGN